jgi:TonB family protein
MNADLVWKNVVAYSLQIGLLVALASIAPAALRLRVARARLMYWQILLGACLLLPQVQSWPQENIASSVQVTTVFMALSPDGSTASRSIPVSRIALTILIAGAVVRIAWLALGFWRLRLYRRRSQPVRVATPWATRAELRLSSDITSPVTFGVRNPVVLLPSRFPDLDEPARQAILCHELLHVERRDWLFAVGEELVRAVFWFHPAIWWLLSEIQLAREQAVDREAIDVTQSRDHYVDALLAIAGSRPQPDLAPAPMLLRRRHLKQRLVSIFKDGRMSRGRLWAALCAGLAVLVPACWLAANIFPLAASPRIAAGPVETPVLRAPERPAPAPTAVPPKAKASRKQQEQVARPAIKREAPEPQRIRVGGNVQQTRLVRQPKPIYPPEAKMARIQGAVKMRAVISKDGRIQQLELISGHPLLAPAALEAVKDWVYEPTFLDGNPVEVVTQIDVNFTLSQ